MLFDQFAIQNTFLSHIWNTSISFTIVNLTLPVKLFNGSAFSLCLIYNTNMDVLLQARLHTFPNKCMLYYYFSVPADVSTLCSKVCPRFLSGQK